MNDVPSAPSKLASPPARGESGWIPAFRALPIRWRILSLAALNAVVVTIFAVVIWDGARVLTFAREELDRTRASDRLLTEVEADTIRLQGLIHRYFTLPDDRLLKEITQLHEALVKRLKVEAAADPILRGSAEGLMQSTGRFVAGFGDLRDVQHAIITIYHNQVLKPAEEMAGLYAIVEAVTREQTSLIWPAFSKSRESFSTTLVLTNSFYQTQMTQTADEVRKNLEIIEGTIPVMLDLSDNDLQRAALGSLAYRAVIWRLGISYLADNFATRSRLLREAIDGNQKAMAATIDTLSEEMRRREQQAFVRFHDALLNMYLRIAVVALLALTIAVLIGLAIAGSIVQPLRSLMNAMRAIVAGDYAYNVRDVDARDEIGAMARAVEVFRHNAIAKQQAEIELKASRDRAETALKDLQDTQQSLIEAEKLAALGGLVAGVAHEVNNPIGISLTVASSFARRCEQFASEIRNGAVRRSTLDQFIAGSKEASKQLVANLNRAAELIQSFKQVAVDRSHADRRAFDLCEATEQIVASLWPALKRSSIAFTVDIPDGIMMDSYPGPYGQVLTNLVLNTVVHAFPGGEAGKVHLSVARDGHDHVTIELKDNGRGMDEDTRRRAFEPFFTTRRNHGGTGLGLHIVYSLVTRRLGGRLTCESVPGKGTTFTIRLPLTAPQTEFVEEPRPATAAQMS
jgi:signal transduction histidine kinase